MVFMRPQYDRAFCPKCDMGMIVTNGFGLDPEHKTFEYLKCGLVEKPVKCVQSAE